MVMEDFLAHVAQEHVRKWLLAEPVTKIMSLGFGPPLVCLGFLCTVKTQSSPFLCPNQRSTNAEMRDSGMIRMNLEAFRTVWNSMIDTYSMRDVYTSFFANGINSEYQGRLAKMWHRLHQKSKLSTKAKTLLSSVRRLLLVTLALHNGFQALSLDRESRLVEPGPQPRLLNEQLRFALLIIRVELMNKVLWDLEEIIATPNWARSPDRLLIIGSFLEFAMILEFNVVIDPLAQLLDSQPRAGEEAIAVTLDQQFRGILQSFLEKSGMVDFGGIQTVFRDLEDEASQQGADALRHFIQENSKYSALI